MTVDDIARAITRADQAWNEETGDWDPIDHTYATYLAGHVHAALETERWAERWARYTRTHREGDT